GNDVIKARGIAVGASMVSEVPVPREIAMDERLVVPQDAVVRDKSLNAERTALIHDLRAQELVVDLGPATTTLWQEEVKGASFVLWNGPLGIYEEGYTRGTEALAEALVEAGVPAVVGGGDTTAAIAHFSFDPSKVFLSTGGGAMLEFLAKGTLPGLEPLMK
ncbi:MAG: phosphoglycerate kinase, partial [Candidatus Adlerbacteria bacterium]|nr:phosphoglycerate kinase [Candidatus Adlerbacteria bacterium]